jgi:V8-like Glu-specific endopeptidase
MAPKGHRPVRNTDRNAGAPEAAPAAAPAKDEPVVLPHYQPPPRPATTTPSREAAAVGAPAGPPRDAAEASFGDSMMLEAVIGNDDRVKVENARMRSNPWRQICALRIKAQNGAAYVGTGWFIGPQVLATAGHCVFMQNAGGWARSIDVIPGLFGGTEPFGRATSTRFGSVEGWVGNPAGRDFDYGVIFLDDPALGTRVGNFSVEAEPDDELQGATARISGYPADKDQAEFQYFHERPLQSLTPTRLLYDIDTFGGQSGSPVWRQVVGEPAVAIGIHTTGSVSGNSATRISDPVIDNLIKWSENP